MEGEKYFKSVFGPYDTKTNERDKTKRKLPDGTITSNDKMNKINYRASQLDKKYRLDTDNICFNSFQMLSGQALQSLQQKVEFWKVINR